MKEKIILTQIDGIAIYRNFVENLPYNRLLKPVALENRKGGILAEVLFWKMVRNRSFHQIDFDRQRIIGNYIVDFYVKTLGLIVEISGATSQHAVEEDAIRIAWFENLGLKVIVVSDLDIKQNPATVKQDLERFIITHYS